MERAALSDNTVHMQWLQRSALLAASVVAAFGLAALLGWTFDLPLLRSVLPGHVAMKANTAIGMILAATALASCVRPAWLPLRVSGLASLAVTLLGAGTLLQFGTGIELGIDDLLFADPDALRVGRSPGRMSELTAVSFVLVGSIGLMACKRIGAWLGQALSLLMLVIALFALSSYGYAMGTEAGQVGFTPLGLNTSVCVFLLALGWLASQPGGGLARVLASPGLGGELARRTLAPALVAPVLGAFFAQMALGGGWLSVGATITWMAVASGLFVAGLVWWGSNLLDRLEREREHSRRLEATAHTDELTGVGNRRAFDEALAALLARRAKGGSELCLLMIDLDFFKRYNDTHGHLAGDQALRLAGALLRAALRPGDIAARYGGEEFGVLLPGVDASRALMVAERLARDFRIADWPYEPVTISVGVAEAVPGESPQALVARADAALYEAKTAGRDRAAVAHSGSA